MEKYAIIVAGGIGKRVGGEIPKQFLPIGGKPVLMHTIEKFWSFDKNLQIIVTLPSDFVEYWNLLCREYDFSIQHKIAEGGKERYFSVRNALEFVPSKAVVAIHDGVRPFVSHQLIAKAFEVAETKQAVVPVIVPSESIRKLDEKGSCALNRDEFRLVQTPQCFMANLIKDAYRTPFAENFTDDASLVESVSGHSITLIEGERKNIKLTTLFDFAIAESILEIDS